MKYPFYPVLLFLVTMSLSGLAQNGYREGFHGGFGFSAATVNFHQNGAGAFSMVLRRDLIYSERWAISLGTNLTLGTEDENGIAFPVVVTVLVIEDAFGGHAARFNDYYDDDSKNGYNIRTFASLPLLLHFNYGLDAGHDTEDRFGFFLGGGASWTTTGYSYRHGRQKTIDFWGLVADAGIRFSGKELGFSLTRPFLDPVGPIQQPLMYQIRWVWVHL